MKSDCHGNHLSSCTVYTHLPTLFSSFTLLLSPLCQMRFDLLPFVQYEVHISHGEETEHHLVGPGVNTHIDDNIQSYQQ